MDRQADIAKNCRQIAYSDHGMLCNHVGFTDYYPWGYWCGNCGAAWEFKQRPAMPGADGEKS